MIRDLDLGHRLGLARPRDIRGIVKDLLRTGKLNDSDVCAVWAQTPGGGRPSVEYHLKKRAVLKVVIHSRTDAADKVHDEMIEVYDAWTNERLAAANREVAQMAVLKGALATLSDSFEARFAGLLNSVTAQLDAANANIATLTATVGAAAANPSRFRPLNVLKDDPDKVEEFLRKMSVMVNAWRGAGIAISKKRALGMVCRRFTPHGNSYLNLPYGDVDNVLKVVEGWTERPDAALLVRVKTKPATGGAVANPNQPTLPNLGVIEGGKRNGAGR
jgi:hypothetical protein